MKASVHQIKQYVKVLLGGLASFLALRNEQQGLGFAFDFMYTLTLQPGCSPLASTFTALVMQSV